MHLPNFVVNEHDDADDDDYCYKKKKMANRYLDVKMQS